MSNETPPNRGDYRGSAQFGTQPHAATPKTQSDRTTPLPRSVYRDAARTNLASPAPPRNRKRSLASVQTNLSVEEVSLLQAEYPLGRKAASNAISTILSGHPDWTRREVAERARSLGLRCNCAKQRRRWDSGTDLVLLSLAHLPKEVIARRLGRSVDSVVARLRRLGQSADFFGGFKTKDLASLLNVTETEIRRWQRNGWLRRRRGRITEASLSDLCREHPEEIRFNKLRPETQFWLLAVHGYPKCVPQSMARPATSP
jgi:hypothetical protein